MNAAFYYMTAPRWAAVASAKFGAKCVNCKKEIYLGESTFYILGTMGRPPRLLTGRVGNLMRTSALMSMQIALTQIIISPQRAITRSELKRLFYDPTRDLHNTNHDSPV